MNPDLAKCLIQQAYLILCLDTVITKATQRQTYNALHVKDVKIDVNVAALQDRGQ